GFDEIPAVPMTRPDPGTALPAPAITPAQRRAAFVKRALAGRGLMEAVTFSFTGAPVAALLGGGDGRLRLANPISSELDVMRPSALANLLPAAQRNLDRGQDAFGLFEVGPAYEDDTPDGQHLMAAGLRVGDAVGRHWAASERASDAFDAKADALAALQAAGAPVDKLQVFAEAPGWYHPGRAGELRLGPKNVLARFGEVHPRVLRRLDIKAPVAAFEVFLDRVPAPRAKGGRAIPLLRASNYQPVARDFAFVVDQAVSAEALLRAVKGADKELIASVGLFDVFEGAALGADKKSVAISVRMQPTDRTLTDEEIDAVAAKIVANVAKHTGGVLRA
ncbi:MAG: phenylalanine--tRNA ligase subunit beta, partial [Alphaproteobacteria bacterium]|nr:phenylalanine--tRNA ligase subunit beta [Alphaproteobacteria bacterium]